jgi:hypothetical protein
MLLHYMDSCGVDDGLVWCVANDIHLVFHSLKIL